MSVRRKRIYIDQTQNERGKLDSTYSELGTLLKDNDYDVESYTEFMILDKKIKDAAVVVFGCPNSSKLRAWTFKGAQLMAIGEGSFAEPEVDASAKRIIRSSFAALLGERKLKSRELFGKAKVPR